MIGFDVSPSMTGETPADGPFYTALVDDRGEYICITVLEWKGKNDVYVSCGNKPENFSGDSIKRATFKFADMIPSLNSDAVVSCNYSRLSE